MSGQRTLSLSFREFQPSSYERWVEIYNANYPDYPMSVAERRSRDESLDRTKYVLKRFESLDQNQIVGFGEIVNMPDMYHPRKFMTGILVDPKEQGRGVGRAIYQKLAEELARHDAVLAWTMSKEDLPRRIEFFHRRGFVEKSRIWESRLDLTSSDPTKFASYIESAMKKGITFTTLAEEQLHGEDSLRKIHELVQLVWADMPREAPFTPLSYENWRTFSLKNPQL